jgi:hypothetical protein
MLLETWLLVFAAGVTVTGLTVAKRDLLPPTLGAMIGIIMFVLVAFGALNLEIATGCCVYERDPNQPLAFLGLAGAVVNLVFLLADATGQLPERSPRGELR